MNADTPDFGPPPRALAEAIRRAGPSPRRSDAVGLARFADLGTLSRLAVIGLFGLVVLAVLRSTADLVVPMVAALVVGSVIAHVGERAARLGVPPIVSGLALVVLVGAAAILAIDALVEPFGAMIAAAPQMIARLTASVQRVFTPWVATAPTTATPGGGPILGEADMSRITAFLTGFTPALGEFLVFLATLAFFVVGRAKLRRQAVLVFAGRDARLAALRVINATEAALTRYFATNAVIYAGVGLLTALVAWAGGLATPPLWGAMAFFASFIPFIGAALIALALGAAGFATHDGALAALSPALAFVLVHLISENAVVPAILGRRFEINPFVVFVAIVFWTWMWGAIGAVLAVPLLLVGLTIRDELCSGSPDLPE